MGAISTTVSFFSDGEAGITALPKKMEFTVGGSWAVGDNWRFSLLTALSGISTLVGEGLLTGRTPDICYTFDKKMYLTDETALYFSALNAASRFNDPLGIGNGYIEMTNSAGTMGTLKALSNYQGRLAVIARNITQILQTDPDPANYIVGQTLDNLGTVAALSVRSVGDLDTYMLSDSGFRSLRVRDASSNATTADIGTPIDEYVQGVLAGLSEATKAAANGIVEPGTNRYMCFLNNSIYVFSNFRESGVQAWSQYTPQYENGVVFTITGGDATGEIATMVGINATNDGFVTLATAVPWATSNSATAAALAAAINAGTGSSGYTATANGAAVTITPPETSLGVLSNLSANVTGSLTYTAVANLVAFTPSKMVALNGRVYIRAGDNILLLGGQSGTEHDNSVCSWETFYMDGKTPSQRKLSTAIDAAFTGAWTLSFGMDPASGTLDEVYEHNEATYWHGRIPAQQQGTHMKMKGETTGATAATFDAFTILYVLGDIS